MKKLQPRPKVSFQTRLILKAANGRASDRQSTYGKTKTGKREPKPVTLVTRPLRADEIK